MSGRRASAVGLMLAAALSATVALAQPEAPATRSARERDTAHKLGQVRAEIRRLTEAQQALEGQRDEATRALREADQAVAAEARALRATEAQAEAQSQELERLAQEKAAMQQRLQQQRGALAQLLRSAYALGRHEQLRLLLAQDRVEELARVLAYHRYFQRDRMGRIEALLEQLSGLARISREVEAQREALDASRAQQAAKIAELEAQRAQRRELIRSLEARFRDSSERLAALGRDERQLQQLLESLRDVFADIPKQLDETRPFAQRRGALRWPLAGRLLGGYGAKLPDGRRSQGWLIEGKPGASVVAVAPGRVAFADWLKGYGLLLIVDHGHGYMSLYAQNESLFKDVGDWVARGEAVAGVGSSGGQADSALYFELRRNGTPLDPKGWFPPR